MTRNPVNPERLTWARERTGVDACLLAARRFVSSCGKARTGAP